jgi:N-acetylglucosaminyldiphosphoundecaprenol N-acetyl-beta-D-mannosaminyltransferase
MLETVATNSRDDLDREVYCILGIPIDAAEMPDVLRCIDTAAFNAAPFLISTPNLNFLVSSQTDPEFRESLLLSDLCPPDGMPIIWIARLLGIPIKQRTAGSDILEALKARPSSGSLLKLFLFGSSEEIASKAAERINSSSRGVKCVGWLCPGFGSIDQLCREEFIDQINTSNADLLMAALGARNGQLWLLRNHCRLRVPVRAHLGTTINFQAGTIKRAPIVMRRTGFEWLWRIKEEPHLFRRYWHDGGVLLKLLITHVLPLVIATRWRILQKQRHDFDIVSTQTDAAVTVHLSGDASARRVRHAVPHLRDAVASQKPVTVDLSQARTIDARFFGLFLMLRKKLQSRGSKLEFVGVSSLIAGQFRRNRVEYLLSPGQP